MLVLVLGGITSPSTTLDLVIGALSVVFVPLRNLPSLVSCAPGIICKALLPAASQSPLTKEIAVLTTSGIAPTLGAVPAQSRPICKLSTKLQNLFDAIRISL